jgi:hypothetical protein
MKIKLKDQSGRDNAKLIDMMKGFIPYTIEKLGYDEPFKVNLVSDEQNAQDSFGKTAYYSPEDFSITLYVDERHDKDILRSLSHEIVHHAQNCRGDFPENTETGEGYAQKNADLRNLEAEAYLLGNGLLFRDYEDSLKESKQMDKQKIKKLLAEAKKLLEARKAEKEAAAPKKEVEKKQPLTESVDEEMAYQEYNREKSEDLFNILTERVKKNG